MQEHGTLLTGEPSLPKYRRSEKALEQAFLLNGMQEQRKEKIQRSFWKQAPSGFGGLWRDGLEGVADEVTLARDKGEWMGVVGAVPW